MSKSQPLINEENQDNYECEIHNVFDNSELESVIDLATWKFLNSPQRVNIFNLFKARSAQYRGNRENLDNQTVKEYIENLNGQKLKKASKSLKLKYQNFKFDKNDYSKKSKKIVQFQPKSEKQIEIRIEHEDEHDAHNTSIEIDYKPQTAVKNYSQTQRRLIKNNSKSLSNMDFLKYNKRPENIETAQKTPSPNLKQMMIKKNFMSSTSRKSYGKNSKNFSKQNENEQNQNQPKTYFKNQTLNLVDSVKNTQKPQNPYKSTIFQQNQQNQHQQLNPMGSSSSTGSQSTNASQRKPFQHKQHLSGYESYKKFQVKPQQQQQQQQQQTPLLISDFDYQYLQNLQQKSHQNSQQSSHRNIEILKTQPKKSVQSLMEQLKSQKKNIFQLKKQINKKYDNFNQTFQNNRNNTFGSHVSDNQKLLNNSSLPYILYQNSSRKLKSSHD